MLAYCLAPCGPWDHSTLQRLKVQVGIQRLPHVMRGLRSLRLRSLEAAYSITVGTSEHAAGA